MQIVTWPMGVPECIMPLSPQGGPQDNRLSFETDSGHNVARPRASWTPDVYEVDLAPMSRNQFALFEAWFRYDLRFGVNAFTMPHPITGLPSAWRVAPGDPPYTVRKIRLMHDDDARGLAVSWKLMQHYAEPVP